MINDALVKKEEFRWSFRKKGTQVLNICTRLLLLFGFAAFMSATSKEALANPVGGTVVGGSASISSNGTTETINQASQSAIINWNSFNIAKGETTQFIQPNAAATALNRVFNSSELSFINGNLIANGHVIVINPNGVIIGKSGNVNTAGFIASTANIANAAFMNNTNGIYNFNIAGNANAKVINKGTITVADEGLVALVAPSVRNDGLIQGNLSKVQLGAADTFGVDLYGDGLISLAVGKSTTLKTENKGSIITPGGKVLLTAAAASDVVNSVINNKGVIEANTLANVNGEIVLKAPGATTTVSGTLQAQGGSIETSGEYLTIVDGTNIEASSWLLDPLNLDITHSGSVNTSHSSYSSSVTDATVNNALKNNTTVTIQTGTSGTGNGNITLDSGAAINLTGGHTSTLVLDTTGTTSGSVDIEGTIAAASSNTLGLTIKSNGGVTLNNSIATNGGNVSITSGSGSITGSSSGTITAGNGSVSIFDNNNSVNLAGAISANSITVTGASSGGNAAKAGNLELAALTSTSGDINVTTNNGTVKLDGAVQSTSGDISATSSGDLTASAAVSTGSNGNVTLKSTAGKVNAQAITSANGNINVTAATSALISGAINATGGAVGVTASNGSLETAAITTTDGNITLAATSGALKVDGDINVNIAVGNGENDTSVGTVSLTTTTSGDITTHGLSIDNAGGGISTLNVTSAGALTTGNISVANNNLTSADDPYYAQSFATLKAANNVQTGTLSLNAKDTDQNYFDSISQLKVTSTNGNIQTGGITVKSDQESTQSGGTNGASTATATLTANNGTVTVTSGGVNVEADAKNTNASPDSTDDTEAQANAKLTVNAGGDISLNGAVTTTSDVTSTKTLSAGASTANIDIESTGGELYFSAGPVAHSYDSQNTTGAQNTDAYNGLNYNQTASANSSYSATVTSFTVPAGDFYNPTTGQVQNSNPHQSGWFHNTGGNTSVDYTTPQTVTTTVNNADQSSLTLKGVHTLDVSANATKTYGTNDPTTVLGTPTTYVDYDNLLTNVDTQTTVTGYVTASGLTWSRATAVASAADEQVGDYAIKLSGLPGTVTKNGNTYKVVTAPGSQLDITKANLTITADSQTKTYGNDDPTLTYSSTGLVNGTVDGVALNDSIAGALSRASYGTLPGEQVGSYGITQGTVAVSDPSNYTTTFTAGKKLQITAAHLTITADNQTKTYGNDDPTLTYGTTGLVNGTVDGVTINDTTSGSLSRASYGTVSGEQVGSYGITQGTVAVSDPSNYTTTFTAGKKLQITAANLTITAANQSKTYGVNDPTLGYNETGLVDKVVDGVTLNDSITGALSRADYGTVAGEQVGSFGINLGTLSTSAANDYTVSLAPNGAALAITPAALTVTADNATKTYGTDDSTLTYNQSGLIVNTVVDGVTLNDSITGALSRADYGTVAGEQVGSFGINLGTLSASAANDYTVSLAPNGAALAITPAALTVTADAGQSKTYGVNDPTLTYTSTGLVANTVVDGVTLNDSITGALSRVDYGTTVGEQVGSHAINLGTLSTSAANDYTVSLTADGAALAITPATLTVTADLGQSKTYGVNDPTLTYTSTGLVANAVVDGVTLNDSITGALSRDGNSAPGVGTIAGEQVGNHAINLGTLSTTAANDYNVVLSPNNAALAIKAATLTVTATAGGQSKTYGTNDPTLGYGTNGLVDSLVDGVDIHDAVTGALSRADYGTLLGEQVGSFAINLGNLGTTAVNAADYKIVLGSHTALTINPATLAIAANDQTKTYGTNDAALTYSQTGLVNGVTVDGVTLNDSIVGTLYRSEYGTVAGEQVGSYTINGIGGPANFWDYNTSFKTGTLTIDPATLTVTANSTSKTYGVNDPNLTYSASGLVDAKVDGVTLDDSITGALSRSGNTAPGQGTIGGEQVGSYAINLGTLGTSYTQGSGHHAKTVNNSGNYNIVLAPTNAALTINAATLTVSAANQSKTYGTSDPTLAHNDTGLVDTVVDGVTINDAITGALSRSGYGTVLGEQVGNYKINLGDIGTTAATAGDYTIVLDPNNAALTINKASLAIAADDKTKTYGVNDPNLTYSETGLVNGVTVDGVTLNDSIVGLLYRSGYGTLAGEQVGSYTINGIGGPADFWNYNTTFKTGTLTIDPATLTVTANSTSKTYGVNDPNLTYSASGLIDAKVDGVMLDDSITGALSRNGNTAPGQGTIGGEQVGSYAINLGTLGTSYTQGSGHHAKTVNNSGNYNIVLAPTNAALTINPATLTVTAANQSKTYGTSDPTLTHNDAGLVNAVVDGVTINDAITGALSRADYGTLLGEQVGNFKINLGDIGTTAATAGDYTIVLDPNNAALTINKASLAIAADDKTKTYGVNDPNLTYSETGLVTGVTVDGVHLNDSIVGLLYRSDYGTVAGEQVGSYTINGIGGPADFWNYNTSFKTGTLTINPATLTISANDINKDYGTNDPTLTYGETGLVDKVVDGVKLNDSITGALARADYGTIEGEQVGSFGISIGSISTSSTQGSGKHAKTVANAGDYTIVLAPNDAALTISPAALVISADNKTKTYGTNDPTLTYGETGLVSNVTVDGVTLNDTLAGGPARFEYGTLAGEQVGQYSITQGNIGVSDPSNYTVTFNAGTETINPASLVISADNQSKTYGTNDPTLTYSNTGLVNTVIDGTVVINDTLSGNLARADYGTLAGENVGQYAITQGSVGVSAPSNYTVSFNGATETINPASLIALADTKIIVQSQTVPAGTATFAGFVNGVTVDGVTINDTVASLPTQPTVLSFENGVPLSGSYFGNYHFSNNLPAVNGNYSVTYLPGNLFVLGDGFNSNSVAFDSLGRPLLSVADLVINSFAPFSPHPTNPANINISLKGGEGGQGGNNLANIEPAAGGDDNSPSGLANIEPAAGGNGPGHGHNGNGDFACANDFLDGKSCTNQ